MAERAEPVRTSDVPAVAGGSQGGGRKSWSDWVTPALLLSVGIAILVLALIGPFVTMLKASFDDRFPDATAVTLQHYKTLLTDTYFLAVMLRTFLLATVVTVATAIIGYPVAWYFAHSTSRYKHLVLIGVISPLLVSVVVRTIGWMIVLGNEGLINNILVSSGVIDEPLRLMNSFWSVAVGMIHVLLPFMILSIASVLSRIDSSYAEAAHTLGATPIRTFFKVTLPLSIQGIATGSVIVFCLTIGSYITPIWLGRGHVTVLAMAIHDQMVILVDWPAGAAASIILTLAALLVLALYTLFIRRHALR